MTRVSHGSTVTISYIGTLDNGRIFQSTDEEGPFTFTVGAGQLFPALEQGLLGMRTGEAANITISAEEAYGPRRQENIIEVSRGLFPPERELTAGQRVEINFKGGQTRTMLIVATGDNSVTLDGNHPLAGCDLTFALRVDRVE
jgi:FKBP-type peptidyl-prolyl cis-trans isomerase 2